MHSLSTGVFYLDIPYYSLITYCTNISVGSFHLHGIESKKRHPSLFYWRPSAQWVHIILIINEILFRFFHSVSVESKMMLLVLHSLLFSVILPLSWTIQTNFHLTDSICLNGSDRSDEDDNRAVQQHCLRIPTLEQTNSDPRQIITYFLAYCPSIGNAQRLDDDQPHFTFCQLAEQNVTAQQLYLWSAPIDLIENYQLFLDHKSSFDCKDIQDEIFYNCTWPRMGLRCQYSFAHRSNLDSPRMPSSLVELVRLYYHHHEYQPTELTCYTHLQCDRGSPFACLDWTEIFDGKIDCFDGGHDEDDRW